MLERDSKFLRSYSSKPGLEGLKGHLPSPLSLQMRKLRPREGKEVGRDDQRVSDGDGTGCHFQLLILFSSRSGS